MADRVRKVFAGPVSEPLPAIRASDMAVEFLLPFELKMLLRQQEILHAPVLERLGAGAQPQITSVRSPKMSKPTRLPIAPQTGGHSRAVAATTFSAGRAARNGRINAKPVSRWTISPSTSRALSVRLRYVQRVAPHLLGQRLGHS